MDRCRALGFISPTRLIMSSRSTRTFAERSPRKIFVTEHTKMAAGSRELPLLSLHVTKAKLIKHVTPQMRTRYIAWLKREFNKGLEVIEAYPQPDERTSISSYFPPHPPSGGAPSSSTSNLTSPSVNTKPVHTPPRAKEDRMMRRALTLSMMPPSSKKIRID